MLPLAYIAQTIKNTNSDWAEAHMKYIVYVLSISILEQYTWLLFYLINCSVFILNHLYYGIPKLEPQREKA